MNAPAAIGHNNPPDPIDEALAPYCDHIEEAQNWLDGEPVQTEDQMRAVDALAQTLKDAKRDVDAARKAATDPLHKAWKAEVARWKPTEDDLNRLVKGLAACVEPLKLRIAAEKDAAKRAAWEEAQRVKREAEAAARAAEDAASNIDAMREADAAKARALEAEKAAQAASRDRQTGLRTVTETVVIDPVKLARHLWEHDRAAQLEFQADRARKLKLDIPGVVERHSEKRAF
jgi:type IV secretory pathway VirB10-like protein